MCGQVSQKLIVEWSASLAAVQSFRVSVEGFGFGVEGSGQKWHHCTCERCAKKAMTRCKSTDLHAQILVF
jgi:hypothetical protein